MGETDVCGVKVITRSNNKKGETVMKSILRFVKDKKNGAVGTILFRGIGVKFFATAFSAMALLVGGAFLTSGNSQNVSANAAHSSVFTDNFNRANATGLAAVGNGWSSSNAASGYNIVNNQFSVAPPFAYGATPAYQPQDIKYGKIEAKVDLASLVGSNVGSGQRAAILTANYNPASSYGYTAILFQQNDAGGPLDTLNLTLTRASSAGGSLTTYNTSSLVGFDNIVERSVFQSGIVRMELITKPTNPANPSAGTTLVFNVYDNNSSIVLATVSYDLTNPGDILPAGKMGVAASHVNASNPSSILFDDVKTSQLELSMATDTNIVEYGNDVNITIYDRQNQTLTLSDGGAGGTFSTTNVSLNAGNNFSQTVTYSPSKLGDITVTASGTATATATQNLFISPYAPTIGFIGDSLTKGVGKSGVNGPTDTVSNILGMPVSERGLGGSKTSDWANDNSQGNAANGVADGTPILTNAMAAFDADGVQIVHIMLGENDGSTTNYKANLENLVQKLKDHGYRQVIVSYLLWNPGISPILDNFSDIIDQVVAESGGYVLLGDTTARDALEANWSNLNFGDGTHLNDAGYAIVGQHWAAAVMSNLEYQIAPTHSWLSGVDSRKLGTIDTLTLGVGKYIGEFADSVKVDGVVLSAGDYTAAAGSTDIELSADYLNTLTVGSHDIVVAFNGWVAVANSFNITAADPTDPVNPTDPTTPTDPADPADPSTPGVPNTGLFGLKALNI